MRIHEMAKKLGMDNKELITILVKAGFTDIKSANAGLSPEMEDFIVKKFPNLVGAMTTIQGVTNTSTEKPKENSKTDTKHIENKQSDTRRPATNQGDTRRPATNQGDTRDRKSVV